MKKAFYLLVVACTIFSCQQTDSAKSFQRFVIDRDMTEKQLAELIASAKAQNIKLEVHVESYDEQGRIKKMNGNVEYRETESGSFKSDNLGKIIITHDMTSVDGGLSIVVRNKWI